MSKKVIFSIAFAGVLATSVPPAGGFVGDTARKEELKAQLSAIQEEIGKHKSDIKTRELEEKTIGRDVAILTSKIKKTELQLTETSLILNAEELAIDANDQKIETLSKKIDHEKQIIAEIVREVFNEDGKNIVELIVSSGDLSQFLEHQKFLESLQFSLHETLLNVKQARSNIEEEQEELEERREAHARLKDLQETQRQSLANQKTSKQKLFLFTRGKKAESERILKEKERDIQEIRSQIFLLEGVGISMPLSQAYGIAKVASQKTGIRPAFLLAILKQESSWGKNVGQCYLIDAKTGAGKGKNSGEIYSRTMKADRDVGPFLVITQELGRDPYNTLVSCPHSKYGYGGAMGPAQFIPSTWMAYKERVTGLLGHAPDPWDIADSFTASAVKLKSAGADLSTPDAEWKAAMIYYAGGSWNNPVYSFYGDSVMELAAAIQNEIDVMGN